MVTVKNILDKKGYDTYSVKPDQTVYDALKVLADKEIGAVLVSDGDKLLGIFSERDYARKLILKGFFSKESSVRDVMTKELVFVNYNADIFECMSIMNEKKVRHLPVLENNKLVGIISIGDVVNAIISSQNSAIKDLEGYIVGGGYGYMS